VEGVVEETITACRPGRDAPADLTAFSTASAPSSAGLTSGCPRGWANSSAGGGRLRRTARTSRPWKHWWEVLVDLGVECVDHGGEVWPEVRAAEAAAKSNVLTPSASQIRAPLPS